MAAKGRTDAHISARAPNEVQNFLAALQFRREPTTSSRALRATQGQGEQTEPAKPNPLFDSKRARSSIQASRARIPGSGQSVAATPAESRIRIALCIGGRRSIAKVANTKNGRDQANAACQLPPRYCARCRHGGQAMPSARPSRLNRRPTGKYPAKRVTLAGGARVYATSGRTAARGGRCRAAECPCRRVTAGHASTHGPHGNSSAVP